MPTPYSGPSSSVEDRVGEIVTRVTGRRMADPEEDLALDSLGAAELVLALEDEFRCRLRDGVVPRSMADVLRFVKEAQHPGGPTLRSGIGNLQSLSQAVAGWALSRFFRLRSRAPTGCRPTVP